MRIWLEASRELLPPLEKGRDGWGSQPPPDRQPKSALADFGGYRLGQVGNIRLGRGDLPLSGGGGPSQPPNRRGIPVSKKGGAWGKTPRTGAPRRRRPEFPPSARLALPR